MAVISALIFSIVCGLLLWVVLNIFKVTRSKADAIAGLVTVLLFLVQVI